MPGRAPVLVVDDYELIRHLATMLLERRGYAVVTATSGPEALARIADLTPSLVLLDEDMPAMPGREVLSRLRRRGNAVPVVLLHDGRTAANVASTIQPDGYLVKPFTPRELLRVVGAFLPEPLAPSAAVLPTGRYQALHSHQSID